MAFHLWPYRDERTSALNKVDFSTNIWYYVVGCGGAFGNKITALYVLMYREYAGKDGQRSYERG